MVTAEFLDEHVLLVTLDGHVSAADLEGAWATLGDPRFSERHDVIVDVREASVGFSAREVPDIVRRRDRLPHGAQGITCFVTRSHFARAVIRMLKGLLLREARWQVVPDIETAHSRIRARRAADASREGPGG